MMVLRYYLYKTCHIVIRGTFLNECALSFYIKKIYMYFIFTNDSV